MMNVRIIDDFASAAECAAAVAAWPDAAAPWVVYADDWQTKRALHDWRSIPEPCRLLLRRLLALDAPGMLGLPPAVPDTLLWGGGLHEHRRGEKLGLHLDADRHPLTGMERRANAVLYLSEWRPEWGGGLEFWSGGAVGQVVYPAPGRLVVFATDDGSYHGMPGALECPDGARRLSLAVYWWGTTPAGATPKRPRAEFVTSLGAITDPRTSRPA